MDNIIGQRIRFLRQEKEITQAELGQKLHMSQKNVSSIECGRVQIDIDNLKNVAHVLGVDIEYFLSDDASPAIDIGEISDDEKILILKYRLWSEQKRKALQELLK